MSNFDYDIIVVGGGFAGVTAARDLHDAGRSVALLEARDRLGGRTWYRKFEGTEHFIELGGAYINPHTNRFLRRELDRYDVPVMTPPAPQHFAWLVGGRRVETAFPVPIEEINDLERALYELIAASHRAAEADDPQQIADLDIPLSDYLEALDLGPSTKDYLDTWGRMQHGCPTSEVSVLQALNWMTGLDHSALALALVAFCKIDGGTKRLLDRIADDSGTEVLFETPVRAIDDNGTGVTVTTTDGRTLTAAAVVCAIPLNCWQDVAFSPPLPPAKLALASERHPGRCLKVAALVTGGPTPLMAAGDGDGFDLIATDKEDPDGDILVGMHTGTELDPTDLGAVERAIASFTPGTTAHATDAHDWLRDPYAKGTWMAYRPGWLTAYGDQLRDNDGRIVFATSDIAETFPGWIDGAIESGSAAAEIIGALLPPGT